jgi:RNA polymerase sigma-70 factor (ECF subfamily)
MWLEAQIAMAPRPPNLGNSVSKVEASRSLCPSNATEIAAADLEAIYRRDLGLLLLIVRRVLRSSADAEDIVQDAFLRVWRAIGDGLVRSPRAVLFKTAYNLALNHLRNRRLREAEQNTVVDERVDDAPSAEATLILMEDMRACREAFDLLPVRCKQALSLRVVEELSYKEMSDRLGLSVSTIEKHFVRGRRLARSFLEAQAINPPRRPHHQLTTPVLAAAE